jgi:hypothetical protein
MLKAEKLKVVAKLMHKIKKLKVVLELMHKIQKLKMLQEDTTQDVEVCTTCFSLMMIGGKIDRIARPQC